MVLVKEPYNALTMTLFEAPAHVGDLQHEHAESAHAEVSESAAGAKLQLAAGIDEGKLQEIRFRVFACPHLIAAAEWLCKEYEGRSPKDLADFRAADCIVPLAIPVEKTGRILLLEDAIRLLLEQFTTD